LLGETTALDLGSGFVQQAGFLFAIGATSGSDETLVSPQVGTDGDILEDAHSGQQADMLEGPAHAETGDVARRQGFDALATKGHGTGSQRVDTGNAIEHRALAGAVRANQSHHLAGHDRETHPFVGDQTAKTLGSILDFEQQRAGFRQWAARQRRSLDHLPGRRRLLWPPAGDDRPHPVTRAMEHEDHQQSETMTSKLPL
jgi:hypothetical protein